MFYCTIYRALEIEAHFLLSIIFHDDVLLTNKCLVYDQCIGTVYEAQFYYEQQKTYCTRDKSKTEKTLIRTKKIKTRFANSYA